MNHYPSYLRTLNDDQVRPAPITASAHGCAPTRLLLLWLGLSAAAFAQCTVTTTADSGPGSLRAALSNAATCPGSTITFSVTGTITLASRLLINQAVTISGPGYSNLTISGGGATRIFFIDPGQPSIVRFHY